MTLTLTVTNVDRLDNGQSTSLVLDRHGAVIGRSPHVDWSLPDPKAYISSTHCEIVFRGGDYQLVDTSTNGTFVNGDSERVESPYVLADGDELTVGHYRIRVGLKGGAARAAAEPARSTGASGFAWGAPEPAAAAPSPASDLSWGAAPPPPPPKPVAAAPIDDGWGSKPEADTEWQGMGRSDGWRDTEHKVDTGWEPQISSAISGRGAMAQSWSAPAVESPPLPPPPPAGDPVDVWGQLASSMYVDWTRGGFGDAGPSAPPAPPPAAPQATSAPAPVPAPTVRTDEAWLALLAAAGVDPASLKASPEQSAASAGEVLRLMVSGLVVMLEARARAKAQLGAQSTKLELNGNNPLKFAMGPDRALLQLLNPPERGFMPTQQAVEDAFHDLQAHQMATLAAMQGALRATLARFSPEAIRQRAETRGVLAKILPSARNAALWAAYEREFEGVAVGSDEAFMEVFAKAFKTAYEDASAGMRRR